jgi:PDZ domain/Carboxypeptidase regulatory-like domain
MPTEPPDRAPSKPPSQRPSQHATSKPPPRRVWLLLPTLAVMLLGLWSLHALRSTSHEALGEGDAGVDEAVTPEAGLRGARKLFGVVQDDQGQPLAEALVRVSSPEFSGELRELHSDERGRFECDDLPAAVLRVEVTRSGHEGRVHTVQPHDDGRLTFVLARQGELHVALRETPGTPVDDAEIVITGPGLWPAQAARANAKGEVLFVGLAAGDYRVRARRGARVAVAAELAAIVPGQRTEAELTLVEGASLSGSVIDAQSHKPLAGARVSVQDLTPGLDALTVTSDAHGAFTASGLWPGAARVDAQCDGFAPISRELELPSRAPLVIALAGAAALSGLVVDAEGKPIAGAQLSVSTDEGLPIDLAREGDSQAEGELGVTRGPVPALPRTASPDFALGTFATESDRKGGFRIARLAPLPLLLHVVKAGYLSERISVDDLSPHAEKSDLRVVLHAAGRVVGKVSDARGIGLGSVYVLARTGERELSTLSDQDGEYALRDLLGDVVIEAQPDGRTTLRCQVQVTAGAQARCDLKADSALHALLLRVVDEYGNGLEGARVTVRARKFSERAETGLTRPDGTLSVGELPPPPYTVDVALGGYLELDDLPVDGTERELRVQLSRASTLAGFVVDSLGRAVPGAFVSTQEGESSSETDGQGAFTLPGVPPGPHSLLAHHASAGDGRSAEVRARASERLDGVRISLKGRYAPEPDASVPRPPAERAKPSDLGLELRGRVFLVTQVLAGGLASKAGLRVGDILSAVDGEAPLSVAHARGLLRDPPGRAATVRVLRDRRPVNLRYRRPAL